MHFSGDRFRRHDPHAHLRSALSQVVQHTLAIPFLEGLLPPIGVLPTLGGQRVDQQSKFVGSSRVRLGLSMREHMRRMYAPNSPNNFLARSIPTKMAMGTSFQSYIDEDSQPIVLRWDRDVPFIR